MLAFSGNSGQVDIVGEAYTEMKRSEIEGALTEKQKVSGSDALMGHTRSHPEHDG